MASLHVDSNMAVVGVRAVKGGHAAALHSGSMRGQYGEAKMVLEGQVNVRFLGKQGGIWWSGLAP